MFNMGLTEILVIGAIALVIFGPEKLPQMARTFGKYITDFKRTVNGFKSTIHEEIDKNIGSELDDVKTFKNNLSKNFRPDNVEGFLNTAADALEKPSEKKNGEKTENNSQQQDPPAEKPQS